MMSYILCPLTGFLLSAIGYKNKAVPLIKRLPFRYVVTIFLLEARVTIPSAHLRDTSRSRTLCEWISIRHLSRPPLQFRSAGRHRFPCSQNGYPHVLFAPQSIIRPLLHGTSSRVIKVSENKMSQTDQLHPSGSVAG